MNKDSKIYIAGHHGLVGSAIWNNLKSRGYHNLVGRSHKELDLTDQYAVRQFFDEERPDAVVLAAAFVGGIMANSLYRADFMMMNMKIQCNVISEAYAHGVEKLLFLGSTCIYPKNAPQPMKEDCLLTSELEYTNEEYAIAKIAGLKMCESYNLQYGTNYIAVMPTNLYGPNDNFHLENSHVMPAMMRKVYLSKLLADGDWSSIRKDLSIRPVGANIKEAPAAAPFSAVPSGSPEGSSAPVPLASPSATVPSGSPSVTVPSASPSATVPSASPSATVPSGSPSATVPSGSPSATVPSASPSAPVPPASPSAPVPPASPSATVPSASPEGSSAPSSAIVRYVIDGTSDEATILKVLAFYGIEPNKVTLWGTGTPLREFLWSEDMADASVHVLLNVNFSDIIGIEKYSSVHYGIKADGVVDRNHSTGRGGAIPSLGEIRNCHINVGTGKELTIRELSELVVKAVGFQGEVHFDSSKPDGTMRKLIDVSKLHSLGWTHKVEIEDGVQKLFDWYKQSLS